MENNAGTARTAAVPRDRILDVPKSPMVDRKLAKALFAELHERSEAVYNGDGSWGHGCADHGVFPHIDTPCSRPMIRQTTWRVSSYLAANSLLNEPIFAERARLGCEHLMREQRVDGYFPYYLDDSGWPISDADGIMFITGIAVDALLDGYEAFGDSRFLHAAYRGCEWAMHYPHVMNTNYNSFCVFALSRTASVLATAPTGHRPLPSFTWATRRGNKRPGENPIDDFIWRAQYFTHYGVFPNQQPNGGWPGHNSWIWYHGLILLGHARLLGALPLLPCDHVLHGLVGQPLRESAVAAVNYLILNLTPELELYKNHESTEPGSPGFPFYALCVLRPEDVGGGEAVAKLRALLAVAVVRNIDRERSIMVNPETKLPGDATAGNMLMLGHVLKYMDEGSVRPKAG
ncbi:MAG: hypothetical protein KJ964_13620 [Verrucomicrobia bacterium]|nr:hypothetical protein [Verrucomicrobiota bacterium]MBU1736416.1 hypothetical protein [Verrucomicrobiota bacterium]MBU1855664.1 hypothetical protein [Verrucomicrobiota bacterium]